MIGDINDIPKSCSFDVYEDALNFLFQLRAFGTKLGLDSIRSLLDELGSPDANCRFIHIAGTNGKGSTASFISSILSKAGQKTGLFTSPHLVDVTERIAINGVSILPEDLLVILKEVDAAAHRMLRNEEMRYPTFFEFITAAAALYFSRQKCDVVVWETGMGGRLDATNAVTPVASVITSISFDHTQYLGDTLEKITAEKCGIIKPGVPVFTSVTDAILLDIILSTAKKCNAALTVMCDKKTNNQNTDFKHITYHYTINERHSYFVSIDAIGISDARIGLDGYHQVQNAALASTVSYWFIDTFTSHIPAECILSGLESVSWPGRMQVISLNPFVMIDCAHNPDGIHSLCKTLSEIYSNKFMFVIGGLVDKKIDVMLKIILPLASEIWYVKPSTARAMSCDQFLSIADETCTNINIKAFDNAFEALKELKCARYVSQSFIITGSCYLVGDMLAAVKGSTRDLRTDDPLTIQ